MSTHKRTLRIRKFHALLSVTGLHQQKANMLAGYGVTSTKDLKYEELEELIITLQQKVDQRNDPPKHIRRLRSIVLDLLNKLKVYADNRDWTRVNEYLKKPQVAGKLLFEMDEKELKALTTKLRAILRKDEKDRLENDYLAKNN